MNPRIRELAEQATKIEEPDGLFAREVFDKEKFAELIIRECAEINFRHKIGLSSDQDYDVRTTILEHFGVEE